MEHTPLALEILGVCLLRAMKAAGFTVLLVLMLVWYLMRIAVMGFFFGRFPRSMVRLLD